MRQVVGGTAACLLRVAGRAGGGVETLLYEALVLRGSLVVGRSGVAVRIVERDKGGRPCGV